MTEVNVAKPTKSLVRSLMDPAPSLEFELLRKEADGSETVYPFRCRLLRKAQADQALEAAQAYAKKHEKEGFTDLYKEAQAVETLRLALLHVEQHDASNGTKLDLPLFVTSEQLRQSLDTEEMAQMLNAYEITRAHFGFTDLTDEAVERMVDTLAGELSGPFILSRVASDEWPRLIYSLARLARSWRPETTPTPSDLDSTSGSDPSSSPSGTTSSSELPELRSAEYSNGKEPKLLSREEARDVVRAQQESKK